MTEEIDSMGSLTANARRFRFNWRITLFSVVFLSIFIRLGLWQLDRHDEKETMMLAQQQLEAQSPITISLPEDLLELPHGQPVKLNGQWLAPVILLDNVVLDGKVGYEVLIPYLMNNKVTVLINRGFVAMNKTRTDVPDIPPVTNGPVWGEVYRGEENVMIAPSVEKMTEAVLRVQRVDAENLQPLVGNSILPLVIRLAEDHPAALPRFWPVTNMLPEKHTGYAIQWFLMALAVVVAWCFFSFPKLVAAGAGDDLHGENGHD